MTLAVYAYNNVYHVDCVPVHFRAECAMDIAEKDAVCAHCGKPITEEKPSPLNYVVTVHVRIAGGPEAILDTVFDRVETARDSIEKTFTDIPHTWNDLTCYVRGIVSYEIRVTPVQDWVASI